MDCSTNHHQNPHAILVSFPLQGHVNPAVQLAIKLASRGFTVTFINTHSMHHQMASSAQKDQDGDIFSEVRKSGLDIRYTTVSDGLPLKFDRSLNLDQFMAALQHIFPAHVEDAVEDIVKSGGPPVSCLIADTFLVSHVILAKKFGLMYASFWTQPAIVFSLYYHMDLLRSNGHFDCTDRREDAIDYIPGVESIQPKDLMSYLKNRERNQWEHEIIQKAFKEVKTADFVLCNTLEELELQTILALQKKILFFSVGPLFASGFGKKSSSVASSLWSESDCTNWLDSKPPGSVLYVSFGSYAHLNRTDISNLANGLKLSQVAFVWVLRPDIVSSKDSDPLPEGYREEVGYRGLIIPWCSQKQVLDHPAIGGFLSHCGWNSVLESIWYEVPILSFSLITDQPTNRKLVVDDWKIGVNLCDKMAITEIEVSEKIKFFMSGNGNQKLRNAVREVKIILEKAIAADGSTEKNLDRFVHDLDLAIKTKAEVKSTENSGIHIMN